jgi:hypothetical protein
MNATTLNQGQQDAASGFFQFMLSDEKEMRIKGPGGAGKTRLMGHLIDETMPRYHQMCKMMGMDVKYDVVEMTSTTNKAADVLSKECGRPTSTIHSFLGLKVVSNFSDGSTKLIKGNTWQVHERKVVFIDECSTVDALLDGVISEGLHDCKVVWVGDHCQMNPVGYKQSPVFDRPMREYELTQIMRTSVPELLALNQQLRNQVMSETFQPIQIVPGIIDYYDDAQMEAAILNEFGASNPDARILAYTNNRVQEYNQFIRDARGLGKSFGEGEVLINNTATQLKGGMLSVEYEVEILKLHGNSYDMWVEKFEGEDIFIDVINADIRDGLGRTFTNVTLPMDPPLFNKMLKWLGSRKAFGRMYALKAAVLDLRERDSSTINKAQGSSINTVYVDTGNISTCHIVPQAARMLYVGPSRARHRVIFYGDLHEKYGGFAF